MNNARDIPDVPRLVPTEPLPPYAHVPGRTPHPVSDPAGHQHGQRLAPPPPVEPEAWRDSRAYLRGLDLFNAGYYWEAHEAWEGLWKACGKRGPTAEFLKGLIKLAAAGVKVREGKPRGVFSHATRASAHFADVARDTGAKQYLGLSLPELIAHAEWIAEHAEEYAPDQDSAVRIVFDFVLVPHD
jgi:predicted metal-dependent hydrolase